jgi:hypothetical protein
MLRVPRLHPRQGPGQDELFLSPGYRHHAIFTTPLPMPQSEAQHRGHAVIEQVFADLKGGLLPHCRRAAAPPTVPGWCWPRWRFSLTRVAGALASLRPRKATTGAS